MYAPPGDVDESALVELLEQAWALAVRDREYLLVGFGSHHWGVTTVDRRRWFVTLDLLDPAAPDLHTERLRSALTTAALLAEGPLPQAVGPVRTVAGEVLARAPSYTVAVYPHLAGRAVDPDELAGEPLRGGRLDLLSRLHDATGVVAGVAEVDDLRVQGRAGLERALGELDGPWAGGPYGEGARELLRARAGALRQALRTYDARAARVRAGASRWVVTHGEPHARNLLLVSGELVLVDWDTARVAPPARDLWMADSGHGEVEEYVARTGRAVPAEELELYRVHWELSEIALYATDLAGPHLADANTEVVWRELSGYLDGGGRWLRWC